jgi:hypothetical protein
MSLAPYQTSRGWILARYNETSGQYECPMSPEGKRLTGCSATVGRTPEECASPAVLTYTKKCSANRALHRRTEGL